MNDPTADRSGDSNCHNCAMIQPRVSIQTADFNLADDVAALVPRPRLQAVRGLNKVDATFCRTCRELRQDVDLLDLSRTRTAAAETGQHGPPVPHRLM